MQTTESRGKRFVIVKRRNNEDLRTDYENLSEKMRKVLFFIIEESKVSGRMPSGESIRDHMKWKHARSATSVIESLHGMGFLYRRLSPNSRSRFEYSAVPFDRHEC